VLASFAMGFWSQESIEEALGADLSDAIPELLHLADLEVRIARLEILALERLADRDGKSVDAVLACELLDVVSAHSSIWPLRYLASPLLFRGFSVAAINRRRRIRILRLEAELRSCGLTPEPLNPIFRGAKLWATTAD